LTRKYFGFVKPTLGLLAAAFYFFPSRMKRKQEVGSVFVSVLIYTGDTHLQERIAITQLYPGGNSKPVGMPS